ncbi:MAG: TerC/Alx family metal homeostasis membrane protein [Ilumatobacteraceae bacterium]
MLAVVTVKDKFADITVPAWGWPMLLGVIAALLLVDILVVHRRAHVVEVREAAIESAVWISLGLSFTFVIWIMFERAAAVEYISGYLIEKSLSIDNVFVWALIFAHFKVPRQYQHRTLFWGIFGALVMRFIFILVGVAIIERFDFVLIGFGLFLIYTGIGIFRSGGEDTTNPADTRTMRLFHRFVPSTDFLDGQKMFTKVNGHRLATPLLAVLVLVEVTDVVFAIDSVPAVLAVSREQFIVFAANAFAIMGLRALYFLFADMRERFVYIKPAISVLLVYVGLKMLIAHWYHVPTMVSLAFIVSVLTTAIVASVNHDRKHRHKH